MACNDFESATDQWNFGDALMPREEYDEQVEQCAEKGGDWSDKNAKFTIQDDEERAAYEDAVCDDGECNIKSDNDPCYLNGKRLYPGDRGISRNLRLGEAFATEYEGRMSRFL
ncbi:MAG TPA: hypothetical protein VJ697_16970 [Nitrososphaeraceae archaeon]|nr:hypothetical protein [Nitrososphaeraceae archaeon]